MVKQKSLVLASSPYIRLKFVRIIHRHEQMKIAFNNLRSQIKTGLLEAEDVFASLSIPLMKLVGLKTNEMALEGRSSTIFMDSSSRPSQHQIFHRTASGSARSPFPAKTSDHRRLNSKVEEMHSYNEATVTGKKLIENQRLQLQQLVYLLRRIEAHVNSRQENILQALDDHRVHLSKLFQKSFIYLSSVHQTAESDEAFLVITLNLLKTIFQRVGSALGSVQDGVEDLVRELAEHMCNPMMDYVKGVKAEMAAGALIRLVAVIEQMERVVRDGQNELEETRVMVKIEKERKLEALSRLKAAEDKRRAMKEFVAVLLEAKKRSSEPYPPQKFSVMEDDLDGDEKLLWDLLKEKNKIQALSSPLGTKELVCAEPYNKSRRCRGDSQHLARTEPRVTHRPVTRSSSKGFGPGTPCTDPWPRLGSSPSVLNQQHALHRQIPPLLCVKGALPQ
ncbi:hypothetical protein FRX31_023647 [Thalictrum thalictroides]|uniref:Uncharacterized protein n=1 Tax=Thalictrum thalictroides TaxID=46969 RepID=A0A7J6VNT3_THATH|nr:hypothetical protein FRX31_023647 [Thalictrum thalictroides]